MIIQVKSEPTKKMGAEVPLSVNRRVWHAAWDRNITIANAINEALLLWLEREAARSCGEERAPASVGGMRA